MANISEASEPARQRLLEFLSTPSQQFVIPIYQRYYIWSTKNTKKKKGQVVQFMDDFNDVVIGKSEKHFLGILIYMKTDLRVLGQSEDSIIDGQQRLVTIYLLLFAFKKIMEEEHIEPNLIRGFECKYFYANPEEIGNPATLKPKLKTKVSDDDVYEKIYSGKMDELETAQKESNVYIAYQYIYSRLKKLVQRHGIDKVQESLLQLYIVSIPVSPKDDPQKIFESINSTGVELTAPDLIRNLVLMSKANDVQENIYKNYWNKIETYIASCPNTGLEMFFRYFLSAKERKVINVHAVYAEFTDWYTSEQTRLKQELQGNNEQSDDYTVTTKILQEIMNYAKYFNDIYGGTSTDNLPNDIKDAVKEFRNSPSVMPAPLFMELYNLASNPSEDGVRFTFRQLGTIISLTTTYLMRRWLSDRGTNKITRLFTQILNNLKKDMNQNPNCDIVESYKKYLVNENKHNSAAMPTDKDMVNSILNANMYSKKDYVMAFFKKYENEGNPAPLDFNGASIEHIMPESPTPEWLEQSEAKSKDVYDEYLHKLGNLSIGTPHLQAKESNNLWEVKNAIISDTLHIKLNFELLNYDRWTITDINQRTEKLITEICRLYPYFESQLIEVCIKNGNGVVYANGLYDTRYKTIKVLKNSTLLSEVNINDPKYNEIITKIEELRNEKVIGKRRGTGTLFFKEDYLFDSQGEGIDLSASIILGKSVDGEDAWKHRDDDEPLSNYIL